MTKTRVLHIIKSLGRGGAEMLLPETLKIHDRDRFEFHYVYFLPWKDQMVEEIRRNGGIIHCIPAKNNWQLLLQTRTVCRYIKAHKIQLVHAHLPWAGIVARLAGKITGVPVIYSEHNKQERYHFGTRIMNLLTMPLLNKVVAVSSDVESSIRKHKPSLRTPVQTILNGVNTTEFVPDEKMRTATRKLLNIPDDALVIGTVAVFRFQKRLDVWLELARHIRDKKSNVCFIIVGDGPLKEPLLQKAKELKIASSVHFVGLQTDVRPYFNAFDIYMMTSVFEGLPIALLEAMACSVPVIATAAGGIKEVIRHGQDGLLCDVDTPKDLVPFALDLLDNLPRRATLAGNARQRVMDSFSIRTMVAQLEALYLNTVE